MLAQCDRHEAPPPPTAPSKGIQMINEYMHGLGDAPNKIRELFMFGLERKAQIGEDNVFDYSIGNPSVAAPQQVKDAFMRLLSEDPVKAHEYTPSVGDAHVRRAIAEHISQRFGVDAKASNIYMTSGASSALAISLCAICEPGDEVVTVAPFFPEYRTWTATAQCTLVEVPALEPSFQMDLTALEHAITPKTSAIILNTPNNPTGAVYPESDIAALADILRRKSDEFGRRIFLISDEPYREIVYGADVAYIPSHYDDTIVCYTWSKSLSLPGERIGYIHVNDSMPEAERVFCAICGAGRALGYICAPVLLQRVVAECVDAPTDVSAYDRNRKLLTEILDRIGYEFVEPEGAFYLWMKALEPDAEAFSERAKNFELLLVPSNSFGAEGWVRLSYCIDESVIRRSEDSLKALYDSYAV